MRQICHRIIYQSLRPIRKVLHVSMLAARVSHTILLRTLDQFIAIMSRFASDRIEGQGFEQLALSEKYVRNLDNLVANMPSKPKISVLIPVYKTPLHYLKETFDSVRMQIYENWEVCICDDASNDAEITATIKKFADQFPGKVKFGANETNGHICITSNRCLEMATGDFVVLLDHDDRLTINALAEMVRYINWEDQPDILYSDERVIDEQGRTSKFTPFYKPNWSPIYHLCVNYTTHLVCYRRSLLQEIEGFRVGFEGSQDHDLMLRAVAASSKPVVHVPHCLYHWRAYEGSLAQPLDGNPPALDAGIRAVKEACTRNKRKAEVTWEQATKRYRVKFDLPTPLPKVSVIIPTRDRADLIRSCLASIFSKTSYANFEVIVVDNGTVDDDALSVLKRFSDEHAQHIRVIRFNDPFNFGAMNNLAVEKAKGEYVLLLNNDTEVISQDWIEELLRLAQFDDSGAVGCKMLYPSGRIQHAGIVLIERMIAGHIGRQLRDHSNVYVDYCQTPHEVSAVTAACLMVRRDKFKAVGGFDEVFLPNGYGDVDFCLKLREQGYTNLYTPYAKLCHRESVSRGYEIESFERNVMEKRWSHHLLRDPYLNFNLARGEHFAADLRFPIFEMSHHFFKLECKHHLTHSHQ